MPVSAMIGQASYDVAGMIDYLKQNASHLTLVDADCAARELGSAKTLNVVLLGAAIRSGELGLGEEEITEAIKERVPEKFWDLNLKSLSWSEK